MVKSSQTNAILYTSLTQRVYPFFIAPEVQHRGIAVSASKSRLRTGSASQGIETIPASGIRHLFIG